VLAEKCVTNPPQTAFKELWIARLAVVLLSVNIVAGAIELALKPRSLSRADVAVSASESLIHANSRLLSLETSRLSASQLAASDTLSNPLLLMILTMIDNSRAGQRDRANPEHR
jgi:hypothetical protein